MIKKNLGFQRNFVCKCQKVVSKIVLKNLFFYNYFQKDLLNIASVFIKNTLAYSPNPNFKIPATLDSTVSHLEFLDLFKHHNME